MTQNGYAGNYMVLDSLIHHDVEYIFGYSGGSILPLYDELYTWEKVQLVKHILVRHEQSAAHAADAYARSSKKVGVCFVTSGPGSTNVITSLATAQMDSIPMVVIMGQVARAFIGTNAFQEVPITEITKSIVKHTYLVDEIQALPNIFAEAFFLTTQGRPGPVVIIIPKDIGLEKHFSYHYENAYKLIQRKNYQIDSYISNLSFSKLLVALTQSYQPLLYIGGGSLRSNAVKNLLELSKIFQIPMTTTLMGKGACNEDDHLALGMLGMHGTAYANFAVSECDLLVALGARFDDRVTGKLENFACDADVIHIDVDSTELGKNRCCQLSLLGDVKKILSEFFQYLRKKSFQNFRPSKNWLKKITKWKKLYPLHVFESFSPQKVIKIAGKLFPTGFFTTDVGQHQMWAAQFLNVQPKKWMSSSGLGTMGYGLPSALGSVLANPQQNTICISGDASFQMSIQELGTIAHYGFQMKILILNNGYQGMVRQWQEAFYENRLSNSYMKHGMPKFAQVAQAYGLQGIEIDQISTFLRTMLRNPKNFSLFDIFVTENANVYPMVKPGFANNYMLGLKKAN